MPLNRVDTGDFYSLNSFNFFSYFAGLGQISGANRHQRHQGNLQLTKATNGLSKCPAEKAPERGHWGARHSLRQLRNAETRPIWSTCSSLLGSLDWAFFGPGGISQPIQISQILSVYNSKERLLKHRRNGPTLS